MQKTKGDVAFTCGLPAVCPAPRRSVWSEGEHTTSCLLSTLSKQNKVTDGELNPPAVPLSLSVK